MRTLVIGDIHGAYKALLQVLELAKITTNDHLIFLGDIADRWSETPKVYDFLIDLQKTHQTTTVFVRKIYGTKMVATRRRCYSKSL